MSDHIEFNKWLRDQSSWVIIVARADVVYRAMKLAFDAGNAHITPLPEESK